MQLILNAPLPSHQGSEPPGVGRKVRQQVPPLDARHAADSPLAFDQSDRTQRGPPVARREAADKAHISEALALRAATRLTFIVDSRHERAERSTGTFEERGDLHVPRRLVVAALHEAVRARRTYRLSDDDLAFQHVGGYKRAFGVASH
jgi:hypothetical protein